MLSVFRRVRAALAVVAVISLLLGLGSLAFVAQRSSADTALAVHRDDRIQLQQTLGSLAQQYLLLSLGELRSLASQPGWQLTPDSAADRARLRSYVSSSPLLTAGAQVVSLTGTPLTGYAAHSVTLPPPADPGFEPLRSALLAAKPGVSALMAVGGHDLVAFALPIEVGAVPGALLVGFADVRTWPLESYVSHLSLGTGTAPYVLDASGVVVAAIRPAAIGRTVPGLSAAVPATVVLEQYDVGGTSMISGRGPVGLAGWQLATVQPKSAYDGGLLHRHSEEQFALLGLVLTAALLAVGAFVARYRRLAGEAARATFDPLTGLVGRGLLLRRLEEALVRAARTGVPVAILYGDLNGFKAVNDTHGHRRGDALLVEVARRLGQAVRAQDCVARFGGDEFVVVAEGLGSFEQVADMVERINAGVGRPVELDRGTVQVGISLGVIRAGGGDAQTILEAADLAMYDAKHSGQPAVIRELGALVNLGPPDTFLPGRGDRPEPVGRT